MAPIVNGQHKKVLDKTVFQFFEKIISISEETRLNGAVELISYLVNDAVDKDKERAYALKRLVRGVGSNNNASRSGFFTALVGYLQEVKGTCHCPSVSEIFTLVKSELSDTDKGDEDKGQMKLELRIGKVSVCGAVINAGMLETASDVELQTVVKTLKKGVHKMSASLAFTFLGELMQKVSTKQFSNIVWPVFEPILNVPKEQQTMDTVYILLVASTTHKQTVNQQFFDENFGSPRLLHSGNFEYLSNLLWDIKSTVTINHPFYDLLIATFVKQKKIGDFWTRGVEPALQKNENYKFSDIVALRVFITILNKLEDFSVVPELLSPSLMEIVIRKIKTFNQLSEDVRDLYKEAFDTLSKCYNKIEDEECKLRLFKKLIEPPSSILIEKYASNKVIQNLLAAMTGESIKKAASLLQELVLARDTPEMLNSERIHAAQALQKLMNTRHSAADDEWEMSVVKFFLCLGIFFSADGQKVLKSTKNQSAALSSELVPTMKSMFFHCLEHKHTKLAKEKSFLLSIVDHIQSVLETMGNKSLRTPLSEDHLKLWQRMHTIVHTKDKQHKKLSGVFHVLIMHMGLHLFSDPQLASSSIAELESVMKRIQNKKSSKSNSKIDIKQNGTGDEPEWIEVVVDLFLNLMSQNSHLLRKVIGHVFPHLAGEMTLTAFNQILSVVNLKDKVNPLSATEDGNEDADETMDTKDDDTSGVDTDGDATEDEEDEQSGSESEEEEEEEEEDSFTDEEEEDDEKVTDKMRMALHAALGNANPETDTESVDLDNMNEEDGRKLDEALAAAFKLFKQSKKSKPTKADERVETTLNHFRMRVFDLIDIYLKTSPNMIICLELMLYIFEMLPVAIKEPKYKQILERYRNIFNMLIKIKQFNEDAKDVSSGQLSQILTDLMDKVAKGSSFPDKNQYLLKACQFIVICSQLIGSNGSKKNAAGIDKVFCKYLKEFIPDRNPPLTLNVFQSLFRMNWSGNFRLAKILAENGLQKEVRTIRKTQTLQLLKELFKNRRLVSNEPSLTLTTLSVVVNSLVSYIDELQQSRNISQNEFCELVQLLLELYSYQQQHPEGQTIPWKQIGSKIQTLRPEALNSQTMNFYLRFCKQLQLEPIKNSQSKKKVGSKTVEKTKTLNGEPNATASDDDEMETELPVGNGAVKRKRDGDTLKQKRLRKEERLKAASEGMEMVSFVNVG
ncbi:uncharacterized protein LOC128741349 isoform X2 [Sabethes cyaneus]|uniref:uncharacterized protein LOC128741349 isoform X2 n=1 Tax=Sabethes cyaneus TaxID=53552 RepID=UPI00237E4713|nr:uncharacterized protein LOC128741349 isoform X2 [Sabethes cyaneus]